MLALLAAALLCAQDPPQTHTLVVEVGGAHMPAAGLMVGLACGNDVVRFAPTDARGRVSFADLPSALVYQAFVPGAREGGAMCTSFEVARPGQREVPVLAIQLIKGCALRVVVVDAAGKPVADAQVESNGGSQTGRPWAPLGRTDARGELRMPVHSPTGQFKAWARGHVPSGFVDVELHAERETEVRLTLPGPARTRTGRVFDLDGKPIPHAEIAVAQFGAAAVIPEFTQADADGAFTLDWLGDGHTALVARAPDGRTPHRAYLRLEVGAETPAPIELRLAPGATLAGVIRDAGNDTGAPPRITAHFKPDAVFELPFLVRTFDTGQDGAYTLAGLLPGRWKCAVRFGAAEVERTFTLRAGEHATWDPAPPATAVLRIALRDPRGQPLAGWRVGLRSELGFSSGTSTVTDADGVTAHAETFWRLRTDRPVTLTLRAPLPEGASDDGFDPFPTLVVPGLVPDDSEQQVVVPDAARPRHRLRGRLRRVDRTAPTEASIELSAARAPYEHTAIAVAADGTFTSGPLSPGRYGLSVRMPGAPTLELEDLPLGGDHDHDLGDLILGVATAVRIDRDGEVPDDGRLWLGGITSGRPYRLTRADDGTFTAPRVAPGRYVVRGFAANAYATPTPVTVGAEQTPVRVPWAKAPTLRVTIALDENGDRSQTGWSGELAVRDASGNLLVLAPLRHAFAGRWQRELEFQVGLPPGTYHLQVETWDRQRLHTETTVGADGGRARFTPK